MELAAELLEKIEADGWQLEREFAETATSCRELFRTYSIRNRELAARTSSHAKQLHSTTSEFVENLRVHLGESCFLNEVTGNEEYDYFIAYEPSRENLLGIMKTYNRLKVSPERWQEIWAAP